MQTEWRRTMTDKNQEKSNSKTLHGDTRHKLHIGLRAWVEILLDLDLEL